MFCKNCGTFMDESYNVCQECGTHKGLGNSFCPQCGQIHSMSSAFCETCGYKFEEAQPAAPNTSVPYSQQSQYQQFSSMAQQPNSQYMPEEKFCKNCGKKVMHTQAICDSCGIQIGQGVSFCQHCGAPVQQGLSACVNCGKSLAEPININAQLSGFVNNFYGIFNFQNQTIKNFVFDWVPYIAAALIFIISLFPAVYVVDVFGITSGQSMNVFNSNGFCGFLIVLSILVSAASFVPIVRELINRFYVYGQYAVMLPAALEVISLIFLIIGCARGAAVSEYVNVGFTFGGWLFAILIVAHAVLSVLSYLRKNGKISI